MNNPFPYELPDLEAAIASAYAELSTHQADSDEYKKIVNQLTKLHKLKNEALQHYQDAQMFEHKHSLELEQQDYLEEQEARPFWKRVSPDVVFTVLGNAAIALTVVKYEQTGVIRTVVKDFMKKI